MTRNVLNQFECKIGKAGEILCNTDDTGNVLLFVSSGKLVIYATRGGKKIKWFEIGAKELARRQNSPYFYIDEQKTLRDEEICRVRGWVVSDQPVKIAVYDEKKKRIFCEIQRNKRMDVAEMITETEVDPKCGFYMEVPIKGKNVINLVFRAGQKQAVYWSATGDDRSREGEKIC